MIGRLWARTGGRLRVAWYVHLAVKADRDAVEAQRVAVLSRQAWHSRSEGLPTTREQDRALDEGR